MKKILAALTLLVSGTVGAFAADMAVKARSAPAAAVYNWTGFYIGGNIGYGWGQNTNPLLSFTDPGAVGFGPYFAAGGNGFPNLKPAGVVGGGQIGYNWRVNAFVLGAVADFHAADIHAAAKALVDPPGPAVPSAQSLSQRLDFLGTVRGKVGGAFNNVMIYGTGGYAYGRVRSSLTFDATPVPVPVFFTGTATEWRSGWAAGVGGEYGVGPWSFGVEYLHYDLGRSSVTAVAAPPGVAFPGASLTASQRVAGDIVRATINYRFGGPGAVVARY